METFYKITEQDQDEFNKLERAYFEMAGLQALLTSIINDNPKLLDSQNYYIEKYLNSFEKLEKQKNCFQEKVLVPVFQNNFNWFADFYNKGVKVVKN